MINPLRLGLIGSAILMLAASTTAATDLTGLWHARVRLGPEADGRLIVQSVNQQLIADISGQRIVMSERDGALRFAMADGDRFTGHRCGTAICGHWLSRRSRLDGNVFATPALLSASAQQGTYIGQVRPIADTATFYLLIKAEGSTLRADLVNPERNLGTFQQLDEVVVNGRDVTIMGTFRGRGEPRPTLAGIFDPDSDTLLLNYAWRGGWYAFRRTTPDQAWGFMASQHDPALASAPVALHDGWETATPEAVGLQTEPIATMIQQHILPPPDSHRDLSIHALLVARHGKLAVEEYFHGQHRDLPHDLRSAGKSVAAVLAAAAMQDGADLRWQSPVYARLQPARLADEPARGAITLRNLANMDSGLDCDDRNPESAANEDYLWDHADDLDFYQHTLGVDLKHAPGEVTAYCSASANLVGAMISSATGESLLASFHRLLAQPLRIAHYGVPVPPDGHPYMGGGLRLTPRDFLKFPQLVLNGGRWGSHTVLSEEDATRMVTPEVRIDDDRSYGYLWWTTDHELNGKTVRVHYMAGNGGQIAMLAPDLELAIAINAGNYSDRVMFRIQNELIPNYLLPAAMELAGARGNEQDD